MEGAPMRRPSWGRHHREFCAAGCGERALPDAVRVAAEAVLTVGTGGGGALAGSRDGVSGGEVISGPRWQGSAAALAGVWTALRDGGRLLGQLEESEGGQRGGVSCAVRRRRCGGVSKKWGKMTVLNVRCAVVFYAQ